MSDETVDAVDTEVTVDVEVESPVDGEEALGDPGKKALDSMKAERKAALDRAKAAETRAAELQAKLEGREAEHQASVEAQRVKDDAIIRAELKAAAKGKLADPSDAGLFINLKDFEVSSNGDVDTDALNAAIDDLISRKPHLGATERRRFDGDADAGKKTDPKGGQLSRTDIDRMTPDEIADAYTTGKFSDLLTGK
jgi:hypothetical protein